MQACGSVCPTTHVLHHLPLVFTINIVWDTDVASTEVIRDFINKVDLKMYPHQLFDESKVEQQCEYELKGMVCYYGKHYIAYFKERGGANWFVFDDTRVAPIGVHFSLVRDRVIRGRLQPCVLFYERKSASAQPSVWIPPPETLIASVISSNPASAVASRISHNNNHNNNTATTTPHPTTPPTTNSNRATPPSPIVPVVTISDTLVLNKPILNSADDLPHPKTLSDPLSHTQHIHDTLHIIKNINNQVNKVNDNNNNNTVNAVVAKEPQNQVETTLSPPDGSPVSPLDNKKLPEESQGRSEELVTEPSFENAPEFVVWRTNWMYRSKFISCEFFIANNNKKKPKNEFTAFETLILRELTQSRNW